MPIVKLTDLQQNILKFFGQNKFGQNFYWTGGTLLAYRYLFNRRSVDLDFFSEDLFDDGDYLIFINQLKKNVAADKINFTSALNRRLYIISNKKESVKLELVYFPFPAIAERKILKEFGIKIDSLADLMANKILSAYQRSEPKDVFDLYSYLVKKPEFNLARLIKLAEKKFGVEIEPLILFSKINELADQLDLLTPLLLKPKKKLRAMVKKNFQLEFNKFAKKIMK
ncbi:MAG: nucleotidyl transferase AbiEii/AbiGii toxin family protein [bacterium]|nr:nucleotidyl transferase AbiEii/AbiGii toxin family protein [bacterium]